MQYRFGEHQLDTERRELLRGHSLVSVEPQVFDLLACLLENRDRVVSKDDLLATIWGGRIVAETTIDSRIQAARRAIGDSGAEQRMIRTFPRKGFRFTAAVEQQPGGSLSGIEATDAQVGESRVAEKPAIAILPFANLSDDPNQDFVASGIAEDVILSLSHHRSLMVIARDSSFAHGNKEADIQRIGRGLNAHYVVVGSLRKVVDRVRVTARLVEAETGRLVWSDRYEKDLSIVHIFRVQDEISETIAAAVSPTIAEAEQRRALRKRPESLDAWAVYQRGLWHCGKTSPSENVLAQRFFQRAMDFDPNFAGGYAGLAIARQLAAHVYQTRAFSNENLVSNEELARRAVTLDAGDTEARSYLAFALTGLGRLDEALTEAEDALARTPNLATAHGILGTVLVYAGRPKEGLKSLGICRRLDPFSPWSASFLHRIAMGHYYSGEYDAAATAARRAIDAWPHYRITLRWLAAALGQLGHIAEAREVLTRAIAAAPDSFDVYVRNRVPWMLPGDHAHMVDGLRKAGWSQ